ncbi:Transcriptional regulatory protein AfsQ1 [Clostridium liquoris]|uniref:Stage 0 sporulation protein A homolog n=1 Tax=Clostridium liquoris TaxID=1289519 RepID=A0A2T0B8I2_9CLOT|nr:Transcriptional regulatory protein AfsQ1 [Clostridium liquoris]
MNILIAEDEQDIRKLLELHLIKEGHNIFQAADGIKAIKIFNEIHVDLVVLDIMMPGIDGFKVLKKIREKSEVPVMLLTARGGRCG